MGEEPGRQLSQSEINQLVDLLLECPSMKDRGTRDTIVGQLPFAANVRRSEIPRTDVVNIVDAGTAYPDGIEDLIEAVRFYDKGTTCMSNIDEFLNASPMPVVTSASPATPTPAPFKVVIADFVGDTNDIPIADDILDYLIIQFKEMGFDANEIAWERIADPVENRTDAETIAHDKKATLLIWGKVRQEVIEPHFIVRDLDEAWTVSNKWGNTAIPFTSTADLSEPLQQRTEVLALFVKGLTLLYNEDYVDAARIFNQAIEKIPGGIGCDEDVNSVENQSQWDGINNLLLLYRARSLVLMEGEEYAERRDKRDDALQCLDRVLAYDPGYRWAYIHQGNIYMGEAMEHRKGEESSFLAALNLARVEYERALQPNDDDTERLERFVPFKAHINIGTTYYEEARYLSKHGKDFHEQANKAIEHYKDRIIDQTDKMVPDLYLANAYYGLANTYRLQGKPDEAIASYEECITKAGSSNDPRAEPLQAECTERRDRTTDDMGDG
jgi:tetratricopeptide (TPR) repeat protein